VLALDISSACVGFAVFDGTTLVDYGKYIPVGDHHGERLYHFYEWLEGRLQHYKPDDLVYEQPFPGRFANAFGTLMLYVGVVLALHFQHYSTECPQANRVPSHVVKRVMGFPKQQTYDGRKELAVREVNRLFNLGLRFKRGHDKAVSDDDTADAILLGIAWCSLAGRDSGSAEGDEL
jgi:Holliday junction resolvasome RuvABC endonuclease subunit